MKVLNPVGERKDVGGVLAPRPRSLEGHVVGFVDNRAGKVYFERIAELLEANCGVAQIRRWVKDEQVAPAPEGMIAEVAGACTVAIVGTGV